jgi:succinate dehydrogenase/fumarate reductase flavoprotein subunit
MMRDGEPVEVGPAVEYFEGGIGVTEQFETDVQGLYAAGECTAALFGANRVSAATSEMLVTGAVAGSAAGEYAKSASTPDIDDALVAEIVERAIQPLDREAGIRPPELRARIQEAAHEQLGPVKTEQEIRDFIALLERVKSAELPILYTSSKSRSYNKEWIEALELCNIVPVLEASARSSLARTESRGVHYRADFPDTDNDDWLKEVTVKQAGDELSVGTRPITVTTLTPPPGVIPYLEMMKRMMEAHSDVTGHH